INEAVELCKDFVDDSSHALTNSVLQRVYDQITAERKTKAQAKLEAGSTDENPTEENSTVEPDKETPASESKYRRK
ncbi:MAG: transcription antitermination factor NusB, partial [bacterium]